MIRAYVQAYDGNGNTEQYDFDAEPWFEQASPQQLRRLAKERQTGRANGGAYSFYSGEQTDDIWGWMVENGPIRSDPALQQFMRYCDEHEVSWACELYAAEDVQSWLNQRKVTKASLRAVDAMLGETNPPVTAMKPDPYVLQVIQATTGHLGHNFMSGDCGNLAIALAVFLSSKGYETGYLVEYGSHYEMFDHVAVVANGVPYDGEGMYHVKKGRELKGYDEWKEEDYDIEYMELQNDREAVDMIVKYTDPDAVFAHGSDIEKTLAFLNTLPGPPAERVVEALIDPGDGGGSYGG